MKVKGLIIGTGIILLSFLAIEISPQEEDVTIMEMLLIGDRDKGVFIKDGEIQLIRNGEIKVSIKEDRIMFLNDYPERKSVRRLDAQYANDGISFFVNGKIETKLDRDTLFVYEVLEAKKLNPER